MRSSTRLRDVLAFQMMFRRTLLWRFDPEIKYDLTEDRFMSHDVTCDKNPKHMYTFNTFNTTLSIIHKFKKTES